jgi:response regulator of citrate/malate metabolism
MSEEEILAELRTIRTLLALDKEEELNDIMSGINEVEEAIIEEVDDEWSSLPTSEIAEECDVTDRTVQRRAGDLEESHLLEKQGSAAGTEYRETGLLSAAELVSTE